MFMVRYKVAGHERAMFMVTEVSQKQNIQRQKNIPTVKHSDWGIKETLRTVVNALQSESRRIIAIIARRFVVCWLGTFVVH